MPPHCIERTSPKGGQFIGTCSLCGQRRLTIADITRTCPNPSGLTDDQIVAQAIELEAK